MAARTGTTFGRHIPRRRGRHGLAAVVGVVVAAVVAALVMPASAHGQSTSGAASDDAAVQLDVRHESGGNVAKHFVGLSIEWSLVERYMNPNARPAFANLLRNLDTGMLRIGGSSQDVMPFDPSAPNTNSVITPQDLSYIRSTLDDANSGSSQPTPKWGVVLGTAMSPPTSSRPFVSPAHAHRFVTEGVEPAFAGATNDVAGIELGNEPDLSYHYDLSRYLNDLATYSAPDVSGPLPFIVPNTSEDILPWQSMADQSNPSRFFWDWPKILDAAAPQMRARAGAFGAYASDHFYPLARTCANKPYRCPSIAALLSSEHMNSLDYQVYQHATEAAQHGVGYRLEETNTAAGRGADGVSNVAASATYALSMMFHAACPQPPNTPGANASCGTGALGVNFHNAEVRAFFHPEEGNAYYNAVDYDPTDAMGAPQAAPLYYAMLLFSHFAQGTSGLRPVPVSASSGDSGDLEAWRVEDGAAQRRLFLINKADHPTTVTVDAPAASALIDRMSPYDASGSGKTLDANDVRIDGRQVRSDGTWPGFDPSVVPVTGDRLTVTLGPGESSVVSLHLRPGAAGSATTFDFTPTAAAGQGAVSADTQGFSVESADLAHGFLTEPLLAHFLNTLGSHGVLRIGGYSMDLVWPTFGKYAGKPAPPEAIGGTVDQSDLDALKQLLDATGWRVTLGLPLKSVIDPSQIRNPSKDPSPPVTLDQAVAEAVAAYDTLGSSLLGIEVGNEFDNVTTLSPAQYYDTLRRYQDAIRAALPNAHIRMIGPSANSSATNTKLDGFIDAVAGDTGTNPADTLEELSSHYYPSSHCGSSTASIADLMSAATYTKARAKMQTMVAAGNRLDAVPSVLNETNSAACSGQPGVSDSYASALWSLDWLLEAAQAGVSRVQFHTNTAAICGDFQPRDSANYPISYRYYGAFCAKDQSALDAQRLTAAPLYSGLWAFRQVPEGRFVDLGIDDSDLSQLRAYGVETADGNLAVVLINIQDPADPASTDDAVTLHLPSGYSGVAHSTTLQDTAAGGLSATDPNGITLGGRTVEPGGTASGAPRQTPVVVKDAASTVTVAPGTAQIVTYPDVRLPGAVEVTGLSVASQPFVGQQANTATVSVANTTDTAQPVTATVQVPDGWHAETVTQQIPAGGQADIPVAVTPPLAPGTATLQAVASAPGVRAAGTATAGVITAPPGDRVPLALDGGETDSPLYDGYSRLSPDDVWDASKGYGWVGTPPSSRDRLTPDALRRDFVLSKATTTLRLAVPPGQHDVWVLRGDSGYSSGDTVISEGATVLADPGGTLSSGQFQWFHFSLDGGASGRTADLSISGASGNYWRINALVMLP